MKTRTKKMLSLLLATAMVFTMNTFAFAEEVADVDSFAEEITFADVDEVPAASIQEEMEFNDEDGWDATFDGISVNYANQTYTISEGNITSDTQYFYLDIEDDVEPVKDITIDLDSSIKEIKKETTFSASVNFADEGESADIRKVTVSADEKGVIKIDYYGVSEETHTVKITKKIDKSLVKVTLRDDDLVCEESAAGDYNVYTFKCVEPTTETEWNPTVSADKALSDNAAAISENLAALDTMELKAGSTTVYAVFPRAIAFGGKTKPGSKNFPINVEFYQPKAGATVSAADLVSWNETKNADEVVTTASFDKIAVKKVKFKAAKGATVGLDGKGLCTVNKATFLQSVTFEKGVDKTLKKELSKAIKDSAKAIKKDKTSKVSANGFKDGDKEPYSGIVVAVYPTYAGNDAEAVKVAGLAGLKVLSGVDTSKVAKKKITGTGDGKKVTLKLTKNENKPKGFGAEKTTTADTNSLGATKYVEADGNFCGNIYYK